MAGEKEKEKEDSALKDLVSKRAVIKGKLTRCRKFFDEHGSSSSVETLLLRIEKTEELYAKFDDIQQQIETRNPVEIESDERDSFEEIYFDVVGSAKAMVNSRSPATTTSVPTPSLDRGQPMGSIMHIKLPQIELSTFDGKYDEWLSFRDSFRSLVDDNNSVPAIQKLQYLKSALKGEAANVIRCLEITDTNYRVAMELLRERYENIKFIILKHIGALCELPKVSAESSVSLRRLLDGVTQRLQALTSLNRPVDQWDDLLIYLISNKLDPSTRREWELKNASTEMPTFAEFKEFLTYKCHALEAVNPSGGKRQIATNVVTQQRNYKCTICSGEHSVFRCNEFIKQTVEARKHTAQSKRLCLNCLKSGHQANACEAGACKRCNARHHTLLHVERQAENAQSAHTAVACHSPAGVLLATCQISVRGAGGRQFMARAMLDSGSQVSLVSHKLARKLRLPAERANISLTGIGEGSAAIKGVITTPIKSIHNEFEAEARLFIIDRVASNLPAESFSKERIHVPRNIRLADPHFNESGPVDVLIGADMFFKLLCAGQFQSNERDIIFQKSKLGWYITGSVPSPTKSHANCNLSATQELNASIRRFWEIETPTEIVNERSPEDKACLAHFNATTTRDASGSFIVKFPFKSDASGLGESYATAEKRLLAMERKLDRDAVLRQDYHEFMREYLDLGHMREVPANDNTKASNYVPHHAVIKEDSLTTRLRVVFDFSAKTTSGISLNDTLMVGPVLQDDLFTLLVRFRTHQFVINSDVKKMYRQIKMNHSDARFQRILWRFNKTEPIRTFELSTVTYGAASSSFQAVNCLQQLAQQSESRYPEGAQRVRDDFYMDDLLSGADTIEDARRIRDEVRAILKMGNFELRKWASNSETVIKDVEGNRDEHLVLTSAETTHIKTLGVQWCPRMDLIEYTSNLIPERRPMTKRNILSFVSSIYDPIGILGPIIIGAKIFMQRLWSLKLAWDESVPLDMHTAWQTYRDQLEFMTKISVPRKVIVEANAELELHGFSDASMEAYGACIYIKSTSREGHTVCELMCAKSRIAPLKTVSLPRLELCAALLLAQLAERVETAIKRTFKAKRLYSDSTITLAWIRGCPSKFAPFVANRTTKIQNLTRIEDWKHVGTNENPADLLSRGCTPARLIDHSLWWHGPSFVCDGTKESEGEPEALAEVPETRQRPLLCTAAEVTSTLFHRYSSAVKLTRVTAWILRFANNIRVPNKRLSGNLTTTEIATARSALIRLAQRESFPSEYRSLKRGNALSASSRLLALNPFLGSDDIIRVGGRIRHSTLNYNTKHPAVLSASHLLSTLIVRDEHELNLHSGEQSTLAAVRVNYWILAARRLVRKITRGCVICFKTKPRPSAPMMGDLPGCRIGQSRPFAQTGVDFFGPLYIKEGGRRSKRVVKAYGAIFICMATKATHLELVSNLTTEAFLAALRRFIARRGLVKCIYSDNGTNFQGAKNKLAELYTLLSARENKEQVTKVCSDWGIEFKFIPPRAPNFGGLWEANIKVAKTHMRRVAGDRKLTFEELSTLLAQIEYVLNSRPLTPMSNDPNDPTFLTPGHFLIGDNLRALPEETLTDTCDNRLSRWELVQKLHQQFWDRWHKEYVTELQRRAKWKASTGGGTKARTTGHHTR